MAVPPNAMSVALSRVVKRCAEVLGRAAEDISPTGLTRSGPRIGTRESFASLNERYWAALRHPNYRQPDHIESTAVKGITTPGRILNSKINQ